MASQNFKVYKDNSEIPEYANSSIVYGSVAYDLNALPKRKQEEQVWEREQVRTETYKAARPQRQGVSLFAVLGIGAFVVMMLMVLLANVRLTEVIDETAKLESKIVALSDQEARLRIEYESAFNLTEIEEYATKKLGMVRKTSENVVLLQAASVDRAVILETDGSDEENFFTGLKDFFSSILSY
ncbi:MAG: TPM domain-containing protein [Ruminococcaceae bacterium]|nr:TPM domain-containing protein [Oscillospiraceae bacterium]